MQNSLSLSAQNGVALTQNDVKTVQVVKQEQVLGKEFKVYGDFGNPLFLAKDVAEWIEYDVSSVNKMLASVDEDEKVRKIVPTLGGDQEMWLLTENGLYEVLMLSRKPIAKEFKKEVKKILHEIRTTGGYTVPRTYAEALQIAADQAKRIEEQNKQIEVMKPSATSWETYAGNMEHRNSEKSFREVAKLLNLNPQNCLTNWCEKNGYIYRNKGVYTASQKAITKGILVNRIVNAENGWSGEQCKITAYGMRFFSEMKEQGEFGYCVLTDKPEDGSNRPARPSRDYRKRGDK